MMLVSLFPGILSKIVSVVVGRDDVTRQFEWIQGERIMADASFPAK